jgi:hypothetical protein
MNTRQWLTAILTIVTVTTFSITAFAANTTYTQTAESYPPPPDCPPMCGSMTCIICTNTGNIGPQQMLEMEFSILVPDVVPITDYGIEARDEVGQPIFLPDTSQFSFNRCDTCPGAEAVFPAPSGYRWIDFKSNAMPSMDVVFTFVPHPTGPPGTPLPSMFYVSDTLDEQGGNTVIDLLSVFPNGPINTEDLSWGEVKAKYFNQ